MADATIIVKEFPRLIEEEAWNLAIRRSQEVVEPVLKALLSAMAIEYPKVHDVGSRFAEIAQARSLGISEETLAWLAEASHRLARMRAPAFYSEERFDESVGRGAISDAQRLMEFGRDLLARLRKSSD